MLAFALSFDDYVVTTFNAGVGLVDAAALHLRQIRFGVTPEINAISTIIVAVTASRPSSWRGGFGRDRGASASRRPGLPGSP